MRIFLNKQDDHGSGHRLVRVGVVAVSSLALMAILSALVVTMRSDSEAGVQAGRPSDLPPPAMSREKAVDRTRGLTAELTRIDRIEAKLTTWREFRVVEHSDEVHPLADESSSVWVVAVSGQFKPTYGSPDSPERGRVFPWAVVVYDASTEQPVATFGGANGTWPPYFDSMWDRSPRP